MRTGLARLALSIVAAIALGQGCDALKTTAHLKKANELYNAQKYEDAIGEYEEVLEIEPNR